MKQFDRKFWLTALIVALFNIIVATFLGSYNTYNDSFDIGRGWEVVTDVFGGMLGMVIMLLILACVAGGAYCLYWLWNKSKGTQFAVTCLLVLLAFLAGADVIGIGWINIEWGMFASLPLVLFVLVQTWIIVMPYRRALRKTEKKLAQSQRPQTN
ncbi:hypothetical protein PV379_04820 [Streptomyces caniscabiei]|uniref:hypothetical protein n=1 Tax=Streptomyces caniscabiei TaxID=2746961 RepID=UPI0029AD9431|nr:hypothetical protein [Streptomyces caniscabiei]MDX2776653.1 hypothetical protein [Streptomyces caniscabiei]